MREEERGNRFDAIDLPPSWMVAAAAVMWALAEYLPIAEWDAAWSRWTGGLLIAAALGLMLWSAVCFARRRTSIVPRRTPNALITDGPYRFSRNPIYLADALILTGWGFWLAAPTPFLMVPLFVILIDRRFVRGEEARLRETFGASFDAYTARTRRWL